MPLYGLLINTATELKELAVYAELDTGIKTELSTWQADKSDLTNLLPALDANLEAVGIKAQDLTELVVVDGPGSFSALRLGIALVNTIKAELNLPLYTISTPAYLAARLGGQQSIDYFLLKAGANQVHIFDHNYNHLEIVDLNKFLEQISATASPLAVASDFTEKLNASFLDLKQKFPDARIELLTADQWLPLANCYSKIEENRTLSPTIVMPKYFKSPLG